jgi:hypothetical protein
MVSHPEQVLQLIKTAADAAPATTWPLEAKLAKA